MKISIKTFNGEVPKTTPRNLGETQAQIAKNCDLDRGSLKPFFDVSDEQTLAQYIHGSGLISASGTTVTGNSDGTASKLGLHKLGTFKLGAGIGTKFLSEVNVGDVIQAGGQERLVESIESDTSLTVTTAFSPDLTNETYEYGSTGLQPESIFQLNEYFWVTFNGRADVVMAAVEGAGDRFFYTEEGGKARCSDYALASNGGVNLYGSPATSYYLGVPAPNGALTATKMGSADPSPIPDGITIEAVNYVYTFVTGWGYEGPPSLPSNTLDIYDSQYVRLSVFEIPIPLNYNIVGVRIYRVLSGDNTEEYQFVEDLCDTYDDYVGIAEIIANSNVWDDNSGGEITTNLQEILETENWDPIPDNAEGLIKLSNGVMACYLGRNVYLTEPGIPNACPLDYMKTADYDIMGLGYFGTTVVVITAGCLYLLDAYDPQAATWIRVPVKQACLSRRGLISGNGFCVYPSPDGLVHTSASGTVVLTKSMFTKEQWQALTPGKIIGFYHDQKYYAFIEGTCRGFIVDFDQSTRQHYVSFEIMEDYEVWGGFVQPNTDTLYLLVKYGESYFIKAWEGSASKLTYHWKSKIVSLPNTSFLAAQVKGDLVNGVIFNVYRNGILEVSKTVTSTKPFRIRTGLGDEWERELIGDEEVYEAVLAGSMDELMS